MKVIVFRPYKRINDRELLHQIYKIFARLREEPYNEENNHKCDHLIREAKVRNLKLSKEQLYDKIIY